MIRPATKHFLEFTAGVLAVVAVLAGVLVWQLSQGPVSLNVVAPNIRDALNASLDGPEIDFKDATLRWSQRQAAVDIAVSDVRIYEPGGETIATLPELYLRFAMGAVLRGMAAPSRVEIIGASALIVRNEAGAFEIGFETDDAEAPPEAKAEEESPDETGLLRSLLESIAGPNDPTSSIGYLNDLILTDGALTYRDRKTGTDWQATGATVTFQRTEQGATGLLNALVEGTAGSIELSMSGDFNRQSQEAHLEAAFSEVVMSEFAAEELNLAFLERFQIPLQGTVSLRITPSGQVRGFGGTLKASQGIIDLTGIKLKDDSINPEEEAMLPDWAREGEYADEHIEAPPLGKIPLESFVFEGVWNEEESQLEMRQLAVRGPDIDLNMSGTIALHRDAEREDMLTDVVVAIEGKRNAIFVEGIFGDQMELDAFDLALSLDLDERKLSLSNLSFDAYGATAFLKGDVVDGVNEKGGFAPGIQLTGRVRNLAGRDLIKFWPVVAGLGGRDWIKDNLKEGHLTRAEFKMDLAPGELDGGLPNDAMRVDFSFEKGVADYLPGLTFLKQAKGSGTVYGNSLRIDVPSGKVGNLTLTDGVVYIPRLSPKGAVAEFSATVEGDSSEILALIDMEPLKLTRRFGMKPETVGGQAKVSFKVGRPMHRKVPPEIVTYEAKAETKGLSLPDVFGDLSFANGSLDLDINNAGINASGTLDLGSVPVALKWHETFNSGNKPSTTYEVTINADADDYIKLGYPLGTIFDGPIHTVVKTTGRGMEVDKADIDADFSKAALDLSLFHYTKKKKLPGRGTFTFSMDEKGNRSFRNIRFVGEDLDVTGDMILAADYRLLDANFPKFVMGEDMDFTLQAKRDKADKRLSIDVEGHRFDAGSIVLDYLMGEGEASEADLTITGEVDQVRLNNDVFLGDVTLALSTDGLELTVFHLEGALPGEGGIFASLSDPQFGRRHLLLSSSDAGAVIGGFYDVASVVGGQFDLSAHIEPIYSTDNTDTAENAQRVVSGSKMYGEITINDFKVVNLPLLARLLSAAGSLSGLASLLSGEGLDFRDLEVPFVMDPASIAFSNVRASGAAIGVTMNGVYDREVEEIDFKGTLVPAYSINRVFGYVPLIGDLFISKKGEGLLGFTYGIRGPLDEARVFVNPLSGLAPGFLRRLFQLGGKKVDAPPDPSTLPETPMGDLVQEEGAATGEEERQNVPSGPLMPVPKPQPQL